MARYKNNVIGFYLVKWYNFLKTTWMEKISSSKEGDLANSNQEVVRVNIIEYLNNIEQEDEK